MREVFYKNRLYFVVDSDEVESTIKSQKSGEVLKVNTSEIENADTISIELSTADIERIIELSEKKGILFDEYVNDMLRE